MNFINIKLRTKLLAAFGVILLILVIISLWAVNGIGNIIENGNEVIKSNKLRNEITTRNLEHIKWANELNRYIVDDNISILNIETDHRKCNFGEWYYGEGRKNAEKLIPSLKPILDKVEKPHKDLHYSAIEIETFIKKSVKLSDKESVISEANEIYNKKTLLKLSKLSDLFKDMHKTTNKYTITDENMLKEAEKTQNGIIVFLIIVVIIAILLAVLITNNIIRRIKKGIYFAQQVAQGDLTITLEVDQSDEIGELAKALNGMSTTLKHIIESIVSGSKNIALLGNEMNRTSQQIAQGNNEQASSTEEISATIEELTANTSQNANNARDTEGITINSYNEIKEGGIAVMNTVKAIRAIAEKIAVIDDIANQTNMLAINASIEASRVGHLGKGFAVIAKDIKELAQQSHFSADEIDKISAESVETAEDTGKMFNKIVPDMRKTTDLVKMIVAASFEQNSGINQISNAINQLNQITQQNTAISEEIATGSEELAKQANDLKNVVSYFKIGNDSEYKSAFNVANLGAETDLNLFEDEESI